MELTKDQFANLQRLVYEWSMHETYELETGFGVGGVVDSNTFLQIAQRLRMKGFKPKTQEDYLNIITPTNYRFTIQGLGLVQTYCQDDAIDTKQYTVMLKDRLDRAERSNVNLDEYNVRMKIRREQPIEGENAAVKQLLQNWRTERKAFRLIRRWSFEGEGVRMDLSMVRQSPSQPNSGEFEWSTTFLQRNILSQIPRYEVEVELLRNAATKTEETALKALIRGVGEVLRAVQKNTLLITKSMTAEVQREYRAMMGVTEFRGVNPVTLEMKNMVSLIDASIPNIRSGYNVTDKADGLRAMGFINQKGDLFLFDQSMNVYRTGLRNEACAGTLLDGEWVTLTSMGEPINHYLVFDIYHYGGEDVSKLPFATFAEGMVDQEGNSRYNKMKEWHLKWRENTILTAKGVGKDRSLLVALKQFKFGSPNNTSIFQGCSDVLNAVRVYHTDGLILTSNSEPLPADASSRFSQQFKWKPAKDNTVDFLIEYEKDEDIPNMDKITSTILPSNGDTSIQYKTMRLFVGAEKGAIYYNPRELILRDEPIVREQRAGRSYLPVLFTPSDFQDTMANTCYVAVEPAADSTEEYAMTESTKEPIPNRSIVEMRYDPAREPGWRWIPYRIRHDKTERLVRATVLARETGKNIKYKSMMNDEKVANSVWKSIHDPITDSMIRTGNEEPSEEELAALSRVRDTEISKKYYERKAPRENMALVKGLQGFHNQIIKNEILIRHALSGGNQSLLDFACGKAGDLRKWNHRAKYVVGIDTAGENITNPSDGAYKRYMELIEEYGRDQVPKIAFIIGDSSKPIVNGEAGANRQEQDMLRVIFGQDPLEGNVPPFILHHMANKFSRGADVAACMFALHYFFANKDMLDGFLNNLKTTIKVGGLFIGCCFDGKKIFELLSPLSKGQSRTGVEDDVPVWSITKDYQDDVLESDDSSIGMGIDVEFISIGSSHKEYLVPFELLESKMKDIGFRLLNKKELGQMKLQNSTELFEDTYNQMLPNARKKYPMGDSVKQFSFLNRWFIFKREGEVVVEEAAKAAEVAAEVAAEAAAAPVAEPSLKPAAKSAVKLMPKPSVAKSVPASAAPASAAVSASVSQAAPVAQVEPEVPPLEEASAIKKYLTAAQLFRFGPDVKTNQGVDIQFQGKPDEHVAQYMSLIGPFPIPDDQDEAILYPSIEHYLAAMKVKKAGKKLKGASAKAEYTSDLAKNLFGMDGQIHKAMLEERSKAYPPIVEDSERDYEFLLKEATQVRKAATDLSLKRYNIAIDEAMWSALKDEALYYGLEYRMNRDARFQNAVLAIIRDGRDLLYSTKNTGKNAATAEELGGERLLAGPKKHTIKGENKVGNMLMDIATSFGKA
jgi:SAM-dependent methyltransferase